MIVLGFCGIGKSTLVYRNISDNLNHYVDLDYTDFKNVENDFWVKSYVKCATRLHNQGKIVLISAHEDVQKEVITTLNSEDYVIISPSKDLLYGMCSLRKIKNYNNPYLNEMQKNDNLDMINHIVETHYWEIESVVKLYNMNCIELTSSKYELIELIKKISVISDITGTVVVNRKIDLDPKIDCAHWLYDL